MKKMERMARRLAKELRIEKIAHQIIAEQPFVTTLVSQGEVNHFDTVSGDSKPVENIDSVQLQKFISDNWTDLIKYMDKEMQKNYIQMFEPVVFGTFGNQFDLRWRVLSNHELNPQEKNDLIEYIDGQCSDGWGEGLMQNNYSGDMRVYLWFRGNRKPTTVI